MSQIIDGELISGLQTLHSTRLAWGESFPTPVTDDLADLQTSLLHDIAVI